jgi:hypothetical protein
VDHVTVEELARLVLTKPALAKRVAGMILEEKP